MSAIETEIAADRRSALARTAYEVIAESGVHGLSLRAIARRLGATTGMVSHHFPDRAALVAAALDHASKTMIARIVERSDSTGGDARIDPFAVLAAVLPTDDVSIENWRFALSVRAAALADPDLGDFDRRIGDHWSSYLPAALADTVDGDVREAADHLVAVLDGIALRATCDPSAWPAARQLRHLRRAFDGVTRP